MVDADLLVFAELIDAVLRGADDELLVEFIVVDFDLVFVHVRLSPPSVEFVQIEERRVDRLLGLLGGVRDVAILHKDDVVLGPVHPELVDGVLVDADLFGEIFGGRGGTGNPSVSAVGYPLDGDIGMTADPYGDVIGTGADERLVVAPEVAVVE